MTNGADIIVFAGAGGDPCGLPAHRGPGPVLAAVAHSRHRAGQGAAVAAADHEIRTHCAPHSPFFGSELCSQVLVYCCSALHMSCMQRNIFTVQDAYKDGFDSATAVYTMPFEGHVARLCCAWQNLELHLAILLVVMRFSLVNMV